MKFRELALLLILGVVAGSGLAFAAESCSDASALKTPKMIDLGDKYVTPDEISDYVIDERSRMMPEDRQQMTVNLKADRNADMGTIIDVKQALRRANALRISYSAERAPKNKE